MQDIFSTENQGVNLYAGRYLGRVSITRKSFPRKPLHKQLETGHLVFAQMAGGGITGQRARSTVTTPRPVNLSLKYF